MEHETTKCTCEFCKLNSLLNKSLRSNDIKFIKESLVKFSNLLLNVSEDLSWHKAIFDGSFPQAEEILTRKLKEIKEGK